MLAAGLTFLVLGLLYAAFKYYVVRDIARDPYGGGGAPVLDFALFPPMALAIGISLVLVYFRIYPFRLFGLAVYVALAALFLGVLVREDKVAAAERSRLSAGAIEPEPQQDERDAADPPTK